MDHNVELCVGLEEDCVGSYRAEEGKQAVIAQESSPEPKKILTQHQTLGGGNPVALSKSVV